MTELAATKWKLTQEKRLKQCRKEKAWAMQTIPSPLTACHKARQEQTLTGMCRGKDFVWQERLPCQEPNTTNSPRLKLTKCQMITVHMWKLLFLKKQKYFNESLDIWKQLCPLFFFFVLFSFSFFSQFLLALFSKCNDSFMFKKHGRCL